MNSQPMAILIGEAYQEAIRKSSDCREIIQNMYNILNRTKAMVNEEEKQRMERFIEGLKINEV